MAAGEIVVGLDIGTTKVCAVVGELNEAGEINVIGYGLRESRGVKKGVLVDLEGTVRAIEDAIIEAEEMTDVDIDSVYVGLGGANVESFDSRGAIALPGQNREIRPEDKEMAIEAAKSIEIPVSREILHVIPLHFTVDGQEGVREPAGMVGTQLEVAARIVTCQSTSLKNVVKAVKGSGLAIRSVFLQSLAAAEAVLTPDEMELGVALADIGGGATDLAVFEGGMLRHTATLPVGSDHITNDVAICLVTPQAEAERLKTQFGTVDAAAIRPDEELETPSTDRETKKRVKRSELCEIVTARTEEILGKIRDELARAGLGERIPSGIVLTGGGARLAGLQGMAETLFGRPVRIGRPANVRDLTEKTASPAFASAIGLLIYGHKIQRQRAASRKDRGSVVRRVLNWFGEWIRDLF